MDHVPVLDIPLGDGPSGGRRLGRCNGFLCELGGKEVDEGEDAQGDKGEEQRIHVVNLAVEERVVLEVILKDGLQLQARRLAKVVCP